MVADTGLRSVTWKNGDQDNELVKDIKGQALARKTNAATKEIRSDKYDYYDKEKTALEEREKAKFTCEADYDYTTRTQWYNICQSMSVCLNGKLPLSTDRDADIGKYLIKYSPTLSFLKLEQPKTQEQHLIEYFEFKSKIKDIFTNHIECICKSSPIHIGIFLREKCMAEGFCTIAEDGSLLVKSDTKSFSSIDYSAFIKTVRWSFRESLKNINGADLCLILLDMQQIAVDELVSYRYKYVSSQFLQQLNNVTFEALYNEYMKHTLAYNSNFALKTIQIPSAYCDDLLFGFFTGQYTTKEA